MFFTETGDSDAWVVRNDTVMGSIVAGRKLLPVAYMVPMARVLDDIARSFGEIKVAIAGVNVTDVSKKGLENASQTSSEDLIFQTTMSSELSVDTRRSCRRTDSITAAPDVDVSAEVQLHAQGDHTDEAALEQKSEDNEIRTTDTELSKFYKMNTEAQKNEEQPRLTSPDRVSDRFLVCRFCSESKVYTSIY